MARLVLLFPILALAGCSQPPSSVDLKAAVPPPAARDRPTADPGAVEKCRNANWRATGYRHGLSGYPLAALGQVTEACEGTGIKVDRLAYSTGRLEGLALFCSTENGYRRARAGHPVDNTCPPSLAKDYAEGHARGMAER